MDAKELVERVVHQKAEGQTIEVKAAKGGAPKVYDTLSSFSNQQDGGDIVFGIDERDDFKVVGVYDVQALQREIVDQGKEMTPEVHPTFETLETPAGIVVVAHVSGVPMGRRPVYRTTSGITKGAYVRSGDQDLHMGPAELYEIEAFKDGLRDDVSIPSISERDMLDPDKVADFVIRAKDDRPNLARRDAEKVLDLLGVQRGGKPTLAGLMTLGDYPQQALPNLCVTAVAVAGTRIGQDDSGERFIDNKRFEGTIEEMVEAAIAFIRRNTRTRSVIRGMRREDIPEYPEKAVREIVVNSLMHRDYGPYSDGTPTRLVIFSNRLECWNPGGIYGGQSIDNLGYVNIQTRNPTLVSILEIQGVAENRHSGIPLIREEMRRAGLRPPVFVDRRGSFSVTLYNEPEVKSARSRDGRRKVSEEELLEFCSVPRSRGEIASHFKMNTAYASSRYINPLVERELLLMTMPEKPQSKDQRFVTAR